jgi:IS5 family transposase
MGWFFGFKLHLIIDEKGNIMEGILTPGNWDDRRPVEGMLHNFYGTLFADKGYISKDLFTRLYEKGVKLVTGFKKGTKNILMNFKEKILLRKRSTFKLSTHVFKTINYT